MQEETSLAPRDLVLQRGDRFVVKDQPYVLNAWRKILGIVQDDDLLNAKIRYVRVFQGTATIAAPHVLIRTGLNVPDGFYQLTIDNCLVFSERCEEDANRPNLKAMTASEPVSREAMHDLLNWVTWVGDIDRQKPATIGINRKGLWLADNPKAPPHRIPSSREGYALDLPIPEDDPIFVSGFNLELALKEITRYDTVVIAYERNPNDLTPLFIGQKWERCALVMTKPPYLTHSRPHGQQL